MDTGVTNGNKNGAHRQQLPNIAKSSRVDPIITSTDGLVIDDGSVTPRATIAVTGTSVFDQGLLAGTIVTAEVAFVTSPYTSSDLQRLEVGSVNSESTSRSTSPNPATASVQQQQQQQHQRQLHYESANAVLVPPLNFALVAPGIYRSGHPNKHNFPFMRKLGLKVIVQMSEEPYAPDLVEFLERENIRRIHYKIEGNKEPFIEIDEEVISSALVNILDARNHPLLIHCAKGKHRIGCLIGCLRKIQNWSMTSIFDEYRRFAGSKVLADQEFIEIFSAKVPYSIENKPFWLDVQ
ncbi:hypothetical protein MVEG_07595 [Podila verticillata NRRL 6337]|nr:hypothetical protein MVEG_07595 [Podila verticillata NRRL 6337]